MKTDVKNKKRTLIFYTIAFTIAGITGIWAILSFTSGLSAANWHVGEMTHQFLVATGIIREHETLVDFYTHLNGVEYIFAAAFLAAYPIYFKYLNKVFKKA